MAWHPIAPAIESIRTLTAIAVSPSSEGPAARLVAHEVDQIQGVLYLDRMMAALERVVRGAYELGR